MDILEVVLAVLALAVVIGAPVLLVRAFDLFAGREDALQAARERTKVAADLLRLRGVLSDPVISVGDRRRAAGEYDEVLAEACVLTGVEHALDVRAAGHLDRELERFRVEARLQGIGWSLFEPGRHGQDA